MSEPAQKPGQVPESHTPKDVPEIIRLAPRLCEVGR